MATAAAQDQWRLLDVQAHDTRLAQIAHRIRSLPEHAELAGLEKQLAEVDSQLVTARTAATDVGRELTKAETDVEQVRQRAARNQKRLDSGTGSGKELEALQHELASLAARQGVLEDEELEVMERQEQAETALAAANAEKARLQEQIGAVTRQRDAAVAVLETEAEQEQAARDQAAGGVPNGLITMYERIRENSGGVGAARLYQQRCEGCRLPIPPNDLSHIRSASVDEVIRCEECGRILVRTADSGL